MVITCHEEISNKLVALNITRKTNEKFYEEHKKEDMVSVIYNNEDQLDQVFKMLPLVLQWDILVELVGGYVVRYNRLRRLMSGDLQKKIMKHNFKLIIDKYVVRAPLTHGLWAKPLVKYPVPVSLLTLALNRRKCFRSNGQQYDGEHEHLQPVASIVFGLGEDVVVLFKTPITDQLSHGVFNWTTQSWRITEVDDSIVLPPFEKHVYPSYPYTNKKLGRKVLKMKLYNYFVHDIF